MHTNESILLLRFSAYKDYPLVSEHRKIIEQNGEVWFLKGGKPISEDRVSELKKESDFIIVREAKKFGGAFYKFYFSDVKNGDKSTNMVYPPYYDELLNDDEMWTVSSLSGTWFKVVKIEKLSDEESDDLVVSSNRRSVKEVLNHGMNSVLFVCFKDNR